MNSWLLVCFYSFVFIRHNHAEPMIQHLRQGLIGRNMWNLKAHFQGPLCLLLRPFLRLRPFYAKDDIKLYSSKMYSSKISRIADIIEFRIEGDNKQKKYSPSFPACMHESLKPYFLPYMIRTHCCLFS